MSNSYTGNYTRSVHNGRIYFPRKLAAIFDSQSQLFLSTDGCLFLYIGNEYKHLSPVDGYNIRNGRLFVPQATLRMVGIGKMAVIAGVGSGIEIWSEERWKNEEKKIEKERQKNLVI